MPAELLIIGTAGLAKEIAQLARQIDVDGGRWNAISYVAIEARMLGTNMPFGAVRYTDAQLLTINYSVDVAIGVGYPNSRQRIARVLSENSCLQFPNLVHPRVEIDSELVKMGKGNIICKGVVMTCDVAVGDFNLFNWNVTIGHDSSIGSYCVVNPGANVSGNVSIDDGCFIGTGSQVLERVKIAANVIIGAGALVTRSIEDRGTYVGIPVHRIK